MYYHISDIVNIHLIKKYRYNINGWIVLEIELLISTYTDEMLRLRYDK
jgi:hypothetical protein